MKPTMQTIGNEGSRTNLRQFLVTDFNYHSIALGEQNSCCVQTALPAFRNISRDYFETEARQYFLAEASVFAVIMLTAVFPLVNGAQAVLNLVHVFGGV